MLNPPKHKAPRDIYPLHVAPYFHLQLLPFARIHASSIHLSAHSQILASTHLPLWSSPLVRSFPLWAFFHFLPLASYLLPLASHFHLLSSLHLDTSPSSSLCPSSICCCPSLCCCPLHKHQTSSRLTSLSTSAPLHLCRLSSTHLPCSLARPLHRPQAALLSRVSPFFYSVLPLSHPSPPVHTCTFLSTPECPLFARLYTHQLRPRE